MTHHAPQNTGDDSPAKYGTEVLVVQTAFLGDVVLSTALFRGLRRVCPASRITVMVTPAAKPLIEENPHIDRIITYDKKGGDGFFTALAKIRAVKPDVIICPHRSHRTSLMALLSGAPVRVGFEDAGFSWAYNRIVIRPMQSHDIDRNLSLLAGLDEAVIEEDRQLHVGYTSREREEIDAVISEQTDEKPERLVALCPGSVWATKRWLPEGFAYVGKMLRERGYMPVLIGGPDDREAAEKVSRLMGGPLIDAVGRTELKALAAWLDRVDLLIANDSGPVHIASAIGTPTVVVLGATVTELGFGPLQTASKVVEVDLDCRPCGKHGGDKCPKGHFDCMRKVSPNAVLAAALGFLEELR